MLGSWSWSPSLLLCPRPVLAQPPFVGTACLVGVDEGLDLSTRGRGDRRRDLLPTHVGGLLLPGDPSARRDEDGCLAHRQTDAVLQLRDVPLAGLHDGLGTAQFV